MHATLIRPADRFPSVRPPARRERSAMVRRRATPQADDPTSIAINRLSQRITEDKDQQNERIDKLFTRLGERFDRLEAKVDLKIDRLSDDTQREIDEARRDVGELRDLVTKHGARLDDMEEHRDANLRASAEGAARGAGEAAGAVATAAAAVIASNQQKPFLKTFLGKVAVGCAGFSALVAALGSVPAVLKYGGMIVGYIAGLAK